MKPKHEKPITVFFQKLPQLLLAGVLFSACMAACTGIFILIALLTGGVASLFFVSGMFVGRNLQEDYVPLVQNHASDITTDSTIAADFRLDINSATKVQLMELHGIGELLAERIVEYREQNGAFQSTDELLNVAGIGQKKLQTITDWIKVSE